MELLLQKPANRKKAKAFDPLQLIVPHFRNVQQHIKAIGASPGLEEYEKRKLGIFNQLNFLQLLTGILVPAIGLLPNKTLPLSVSLIACLPAMLSLLALCFNYWRKRELALLTYFILYPFFTCFVYISSLNLGVQLYFVLYGILAVFFLQNTGYMVFTIAMSMMSYFLLSVVLKHFQYQLEVLNYPLFLLNQFLAILFIFYGLILIRQENGKYQHSILRKNAALHKKNEEIRLQKRELAEKAKLLRLQKQELTELNATKDKLFSIVAHDLRAPLYGLRHLFATMAHCNLPAEQVKERLPEVLADINYTIGLMENLLQWTKSQMQAHTINRTLVDIAALIRDVVQLLHPQAEAKNIYVENAGGAPVAVFADKEMLALVLRNLLSNAIKFTPAGGYIEVGVRPHETSVQAYVQDTGVGISAAALQKIQAQNYYTTHGTAKESGTGLGLMLCNEFLTKNGSQLHIESREGEGSTFWFALPEVKPV